jgi:hypothetical protein
MANKTIQFLGQGYAPTGTDPINVTATLDGNVVYTGTIPTLYTSDINRLPSAQVVLFTCELPINFAGTVPMSITLDGPVGVSVWIEQVESNYMPTDNPRYTESERETLLNPATTPAERIAIYTTHAVPPLSAAEIAIFETGTTEEKDALAVSLKLRAVLSLGPNQFTGVSNEDPRSNVVINGVSYVPTTTTGGTTGWLVEVVSAEEPGTIECNLTLSAGLGLA